MTGNSTTATSISLDESGMLDDVNYVFGSHLYVRKLVINMDDVLATLKENIRYIHLYCDTLECKVIDSYSYKFYMPSNVHTLHIFARSFLPKVSEILCWSDYNAQEIAVYYDQSLSPASLLVKEEVDHDGIAINHQLINCPERKVNSDGSITEAGHTHVFDQVTNPPAFPTELENANYHNQNESAALTDAGKPISTPLMSSLGRRIILSSTDEEMKVLPLRIVPQVELEEPSLADIQAFGKDMRKTSNLFGLLYQILRSVTMTIFTGQGIDTMISKLRFIIQCTHSSPSHGRFTANAQKLLERLQCSISYPAISSSKDTRYYIPQLRLRECINVLQVGVKGAVEIQKQLDTLAKELAKEDDLHKGFSTILEQMGTNIAVFIESAKDTEKAQTAIENWETQKQAMLSANDNLKIARDTFNGGIKKYNQEKQKELKEEMLKISGELIVSVVTAIATCGAGAPLTVGNLEKAQKAIAKGVETGDKLKVLLEKICQAAANIAPKMSAASKSQQACNQIMDRINKSESGDSSSNKQGLKDAAETLTQKTLATMPDDVTARYWK
ncbi:hypothetical protein N7490_006141 [Penicillium lividum]|nr:hypothetical protein N7490_006141 [Penicillium lividum]